MVPHTAHVCGLYQVNFVQKLWFKFRKIAQEPDDHDHHEGNFVAGQQHL